MPKVLVAGANEVNPWVIKADIHQFFDNLAWGVLMGQLERLKISTGWVQLIEQQLKAGMILQGQFYRLNSDYVCCQGQLLKKVEEYSFAATCSRGLFDVKY